VTEAKPRESGILFSGAMVKAILAGRKTQTRRLITPRPPRIEDVHARAGDGYDLVTLHDAPSQWVPSGPVWAVREILGHEPLWRCPYGAAGDRLWVRETFSTDARSVYPCPPVWYRADFDRNDDPSDGEHSRGCDAGKTGQPVAECFACAGGLRWRPCLFMPRKLSRITLEITEVRVQRLQDISEDDARSEGLALEPAILKGHAVGCFSRLWDGINGKAETMLDDDGEPVLDDHDRPIKIAPKAWATNPWVWAITFRRLP